MSSCTHPRSVFLACRRSKKPIFLRQNFPSTYLTGMATWWKRKIKPIILSGNLPRRTLKTMANELPATTEAGLSEQAAEVYSRFDALLPQLAADLVRSSQDMSDSANESFARSPDSPAEHAPAWHQYGIITHTREFCNALQNAVPALLETWGLSQPVDRALSTEIDGLPKRDLLQIAG